MSKLQELEEDNLDADDILIRELATNVEQVLITIPKTSNPTCYAVHRNMSYNPCFVALFKTRNAAHSHIVRLAVNSAMVNYRELIESESDANKNNAPIFTQPGFLKFVNCSLKEDFKIELLDHLDIEQPVYIIQSQEIVNNSIKDLTVRLTNSLEVWKATSDTSNIIAQKLRNSDNDKWIEDYILVTDPSLPAFEPNSVVRRW